MRITRWEPFRDMEQFLGRLTPAGFRAMGRTLPGFGDERFEWTPSADISETEQEYLVIPMQQQMKMMKIQHSLV